MFRKKFSTQNSTNIRHSERKTLFPQQIDAFFNSKQQFSLTRVLLATGSTIRLFIHDKEPLFFQINSNSTLFPTIYFLWHYPLQQQFPIIFIHSNILPILQNGSDLMIPGILLNYPFLDFKVDSAVAIAIVSEEKDESSNPICYGPVAVGRALLSSADLKQKRQMEMKGKAIEILHTYCDTLWDFGSKRTLPKMERILRDERETSGTGEPISQNRGPVELTSEGNGNPLSEFLTQEQKSKIERNEENVNERESDECKQKDMDELLRTTFFSTLRWKLNQNVQLPIDAGQFYACYILKNLPAGKRLEIKKTRYKKFAVFLRDINSETDDWVVQIKTAKGVDSIEAINFNHPLIQTAVEPQNEDLESERNEPLLKIQENMYSLTEKVMPLFRQAGFKKGDIVDVTKVHAILLDYAQKQNLLQKNKKEIMLDDTLQIIVQHFIMDEKFPINKLVQKICSAMTNAIIIQTREGKQIMHRNKGPSIDLKIEKRSGNKLVTLVSNLASFGIDAKTLDKEVKGTGTSILPSAPACDGPQLLVQGNEINRIGKILVSFGVPQKMIKGLELGIKEPKKKKK